MIITTLRDALQPTLTLSLLRKMYVDLNLGLVTHRPISLAYDIIGVPQSIGNLIQQFTASHEQVTRYLGNTEQVHVFLLKTSAVERLKNILLYINSIVPVKLN
jgi:predicted aldo/keto reductase-like oxidoreductase